MDSQADQQGVCVLGTGGVVCVCGGGGEMDGAGGWGRGGGGRQARMGRS